MKLRWLLRVYGHTWQSLPINEGHIEVLNPHSRTVSSEQLKQIQIAAETTGHINVLLIKK